VEGLRQTAPNLPVLIVDDGSTSIEKRDELAAIVDDKVVVWPQPHQGFIDLWLGVMKLASEGGLPFMSGKPEAMVLLEDDLLFASGWLQTLQEMAQGAVDAGYKPGAMSCLRVHDEPQAGVVELNGIEAYQSMGHSFQVNYIPAAVVARFDVVEQAAERARAGSHGLDIWWIGGIADRLWRTSFISMQSWVAHMGLDDSVVAGQGYRSFNHHGHNLVPELQEKLA
jgi:hypothetical protein